MRWREGSAAVAGHGLLLVFFCVVKAATQPGEEPAVMAHPITVKTLIQRPAELVVMSFFNWG